MDAKAPSLGQNTTATTTHLSAFSRSNTLKLTLAAILPISICWSFLDLPRSGFLTSTSIQWHDRPEPDRLVKLFINRSPFSDFEGSIHRSRLSSRGAIVHCWPSNGGFITRNVVSRLEMDYLGLSTFNDVAKDLNDTVEEDAFCDKLERMGGQTFSEEWHSAEAQTLRNRPIRAWLAWRPVRGQQTFCMLLVNINVDYVATGMIDLANTMDERCVAILKLGGRELDDWQRIRSMIMQALAWKAEDNRDKPKEDMFDFGDLLL